LFELACAADSALLNDANGLCDAINRQNFCTTVQDGTETQAVCSRDLNAVRKTRLKLKKKMDEVYQRAVAPGSDGFHIVFLGLTTALVVVVLLLLSFAASKCCNFRRGKTGTLKNCVEALPE